MRDLINQNGADGVVELEALKAKLAEIEAAKTAERVVAQPQQPPAATKPKGKKTGPKTGEKNGPEIDRLKNQGLNWKTIKKLMDAKTGTHRSVDAYQGLLKRWRAAQQSSPPVKNRRIKFDGKTVEFNKAVFLRKI
jgi:DNA invertase Pin-like site-specific DNA recombinase